MTVEEINKINDNPRQKRVMSFLDLIETKGYVINDFGKMTEITEAVANGNTSVIDKLNSLQKLEEDLAWGERSTNVFRENMKASLDGLANIVNNHISVKDTNEKGKDFNDRVRDLKFKLGIIQDFDRVQKAEESRKETKRLIDGLGARTDLTQEQKMAEYRRLMFVYNGPNLSAIETAKRISASNEKAVEGKMFDMAFINEIIQDLKAISSVVYSMEFSEIKKADGSLMQSSDDVRKELIDQFSNITTIVNDYRLDIVKYNGAKKAYDTVLTDLGIESTSDKTKAKTVPTPVEASSVIEPVVEPTETVVAPEVTPEIVTEVKMPAEEVEVKKPAEEAVVETRDETVVNSESEIDSMISEIESNIPEIVETTPEEVKPADEIASDSTASSDAEVYEEPLLVTWNGSNRVAIPGVGEPNGLLEEGKTYEVEYSEIIHGLKYFKIKGLPGMFDAGIFNTLNIELDPETSKLEETSSEIDSDNSELEESSVEVDSTEPEVSPAEEVIEFEVADEAPEVKPVTSSRGREVTSHDEPADKLKKGSSVKSLMGFTLGTLACTLVGMNVTIFIAIVWALIALLSKTPKLAKVIKKKIAKMKKHTKNLDATPEEMNELNDGFAAAEEELAKAEGVSQDEELKEGFGK